MPIIETKSTLFQARIKGAPMNTSKFRRPGLWQAPEVSHAIDVAGTVPNHLGAYFFFSLLRGQKQYASLSRHGPLAPRAPFRAEEDFIHFDFHHIERTVRFAKLGDAFSGTPLDLCNSTAVRSCRRRGFSRFDIQSGQPSCLPKFLLGNSGAVDIFINRWRTITYVDFSSS